MKKAPHTRMVRLREKSTGTVREAWPVDARDMLNTGGWEVVPADTSLGPPAPQVPATPPTHATPTQQLEAKSYKDLQALAKRAGLNGNQKKEDLIAALLPLVAAQVVKVQPDPVAFAVTAET